MSLPILLANEFIPILTRRGQQIFLVVGVAPIVLGAVLVVVGTIMSCMWDTPAESRRTPNKRPATIRVMANDSPRCERA